MHGLIFGGLREYASHRLGEEAAAGLWAGREYDVESAYEDAELLAQLEHVRAAAGGAGDELQREFGSFVAQSLFVRLFPNYYAANEGVVPFLLGIEEKIHEVVRATIPGTSPPKLHVHALGAGLLISYTSARQLCPLLEGLVLGSAAFYEERVALEEIQCMHAGYPGCVFTLEKL